MPDHSQRIAKMLAGTVLSSSDSLTDDMQVDDPGRIYGPSFVVYVLHEDDDAEDEYTVTVEHRVQLY